jgi:hypothetical protein
MSDFCLGSHAMAHIAVQTELMDRMSLRAGISPGAHQRAGLASWYEARLRCLNCAFGEQCERAVASARTFGEAGVPKFCANRDFFTRRQHPGGCNEH